jgi:biopolymer transport protein ExbD
VRRKRKGEPGPEVELPITPMLDMAFQLLVFFIFTYHPSSLEVQMEMSLPAAGEAKAQDAKDVDPNKISDSEIEEPAQITVIAKTQLGGTQTGALSQMVVDGLSKITLSNVKELSAHLRKLKGDQQLTSKEKISIQADSGLRWSHVVEIMDACKKAGFSNIGFAPPSDLGGVKEEK